MMDIDSELLKDGTALISPYNEPNQIDEHPSLESEERAPKPSINDSEQPSVTIGDNAILPSAILYKSCDQSTKVVGG